MAKYGDSDSDREVVSPYDSHSSCARSYPLRDEALFKSLEKCRSGAARCGNPNSYISSKKQLLEVGSALHFLPLQSQCLLRMLYFEERSELEIAEELGIAAHEIETKLHESFQFLRRGA